MSIDNITRTSIIRAPSFGAVTSLILVFGTITGCGGNAGRPDRANVSGSVTYQSKPLPGGVVTFISEKDAEETASCILLPDGTYTVADAPLGETTITIDTQAIRSGAADRFVEISAKYNSAETSELTYTVQQGENTDVNFELK